MCKYSLSDSHTRWHLDEAVELHLLREREELEVVRLLAEHAELRGRAHAHGLAP